MQKGFREQREGRTEREREGGINRNRAAERREEKKMGCSNEGGEKHRMREKC